MANTISVYEDSQEPCLYRDDEEYQKLAVRAVSCIEKQQTQMQEPGHIRIDCGGKQLRRYQIFADDHILHRAEDHREDVHQDYTGEIE